MLDEKDLQMVAKLIGESEARMTEKITKLTGESEARMLVMMESYFGPKFDLLEDQIKLIQEKLIPAEALDETEARLDVLEAVVKRHSLEIKKLKKAQ